MPTFRSDALGELYADWEPVLDSSDHELLARCWVRHNMDRGSTRLDKQELRRLLELATPTNWRVASQVLYDQLELPFSQLETNHS